MKFIFTAALTIVCAGCQVLKPPEHAVVGVSFKKIGIIVSQNPVTKTPEATIGYYSGTYHRVPTDTTNVPSVNASINLDQEGFSTGIEERFQTGKAADSANENLHLRQRDPQ